MKKAVSHSVKQSLAIVATAALLAGCGKDGPAAPNPTDAAVATLRTATTRYQKLDSAFADGFVLLHDCETRLDNEQVGTVYFNPARLTDGVIDPEKPDALIYEPGRDGAPPKLVGVELAIPYALWTQKEPPQFLDATFQREDEFGVFGLHVWVWRDNPKGLFAEANPRVSCGTK